MSNILQSYINNMWTNPYMEKMSNWGMGREMETSIEDYEKYQGVNVQKMGIDPRFQAQAQHG